MQPAQQIAEWADKLRDMTAMGLHYARDQYDRQRYEAIQIMIVEMLALATAQPRVTLDPLRASVLARPTPISGGDGAVIDERGNILLIQRADNGKWAMPGGALEVGETAAQGAVREVLEETGTTCAATRLVGVFDSRYTGLLSTNHVYHFVFLCAPDASRPPQPASHAHEVLQTAWVHETALPALANNMLQAHSARIIEAFRVWHGDSRAFFDPSQPT